MQENDAKAKDGSGTGGDVDPRHRGQDSASVGAAVVAGVANQEDAFVPSGSAAFEASTLTTELAAAQAEAAEHYESFLRARAEMENLRRRGQEDVTKAHKFAIESFAEHLVPVMDSLEAALADNSSDRAKLREGVELTLRQLMSAFEKGKLVAINPLGEKFDPHRQQAISMLPSTDVPANHVVAVLQKGWLLADRVLRPALVTVSQG